MLIIVGVGEGLVVVDSVVVLVVASGYELAAGAAVSVFCSQAARSAAPARMQMYFFIVGKAPSNDVTQQECNSAVRFTKAPRISVRVPQPPPDTSACHLGC